MIYVCPDIEISIVEDAFEAWNSDEEVRQAYGCPEQALLGDGVSRIAMGTTFEGELGSTASYTNNVVDSSSSAPLVLEHDILIAYEAADYDLRSVVTHEVGHYLGIEQHVAEPDAVMVSCLAPGAVHREPTDADFRALTEAGEGTTGAGVDYPCQLGCSGTGGPALWLVLLAFVIVRRDVRRHKRRR